MPGIIRQHSGANGVYNYLPDNGNITLTRDVNDRIVLITIDCPDGRQFQKTITRTAGGLISIAHYWVQTIFI